MIMRRPRFNENKPIVTNLAIMSINVRNKSIKRRISKNMDFPWQVMGIRKVLIQLVKMGSLCSV